MKIILFMAMSLNGFTSRKDGSEDFLSDLDWNTFCSLTKKARCLITSRKTYDNVRGWEGEDFDYIKNTKKIIISRNKSLRLDKEYILANSPKESIKKAKSLGYKSAVLTAGPQLTKHFIQEKLIDEIIINIDPIAIPEGLALFQENNSDLRLKLIKVKKLKQGIVQLHYKIK